MADPDNGKSWFEGIATFLREHFTPLESFLHSAHVRMLTYQDRVDRRIDRFKSGNHVEFHDTIFSDKVQIRQHAKQAWAAFKADTAQYLKDEKAYEDNRKAKEMRLRNARQGMVDIAFDIETRARGGTLSPKEQEVFKALTKNRKEAMEVGERELRSRIKKELEVDKAAHDAIPVQNKRTIAGWRQQHDSTVKSLKYQRDHATKKWVHQQVEFISKKQKQVLTVTVEEQNFLNLVDAVGERRAARQVKQQIEDQIHAQDEAFLQARATFGSPTQRLLARLHLVSDEAVLSIKNIGKNVAEASVFAANRADAAIQLGFDVAIDYTQGAVTSAIEGTKAGAHAATVKPLKAAIRKAF